MTACQCQGIEFVALKRENVYEFEGSVIVIAQTPWDQINLPQTAGWKVRGTIKLQCINEHTLAASVSQSTAMSLELCIYSNVQFISYFNGIMSNVFTVYST